MPRLLALKSWSGRNAGEEFDASDFDARILCAPDGLGGQKARILSRDMRAEEQTPPPSPAPAPADRPERRRYLRRDLRAQE